MPRGRIVEIYGPESSGKTTLALQIVAEAQAAGGVAAFIDAEHALDPSYASRLGVDIDEILISQPDTGEQALEICDMLVRSGAIDVVVIDSVAALVPRAELEGEMGDTTVGLQARLMSQALRKLAGSLSQLEHDLHLHQPAAREDRRHVRQPRDHQRWSRAQVLLDRSHRRAPHRLDQAGHRDRRQPRSRQGRQEQGRGAVPHAEFDLMYGTGISKEGSILDLGVEEGIVAKSGAWYTYGAERLGQGREAAKDFLRENPALRDEIDGKVRTSLGLPSNGDIGACRAGRRRPDTAGTEASRGRQVAQRDVRHARTHRERRAGRQGPASRVRRRP